MSVGAFQFYYRLIQGALEFLLVNFHQQVALAHDVALFGGKLDDFSRYLSADRGVGGGYAALVGVYGIHGRNPPIDAVNGGEHKTDAEDEQRDDVASFAQPEFQKSPETGWFNVLVAVFHQV